MNQSIFLAIVTFTLGIIATIFTQALLRHFRYADGRRKRKIEHLQKVRDWMESYRALFNCKYPEFYELVLAHKMLSPQYPHYDKTASARLYTALKEYRDTKAKHDEIARKAYASLQSLSDKKLDALYSLNIMLSYLFRKMRIFKGTYLFPVSFTSDITGHLKLIGEYRYKIFDEFPKKAIHHLEWEKLDYIVPDELFTIIHPWLKFYEGNESESEYHEREIRMFDEMNNLSYFRSEGQREIDEILAKIYYQEEEKWFTPNN